MKGRSTEFARRALILGAVALAVATAACSSDGGATPSTSTASTSVVTDQAVDTAPATTTSPTQSPTSEPAATDPPATQPSATEPAATDAATSTTAPDIAGFAIPPERMAEHEADGYGWLLDVEYPEQPTGVAWPTLEWPRGALPAGVEEAEIDAILESAFAPDPNDPSDKVEALLVVQGGELLVDEYNGWEPTDAHVSWSMAKSITQVMLGVLAADGRIDPFAPAPVPEWADPNDPRHEITIDDLLHMRSGLEWEEVYNDPEADAIRMLFGDGRANRGAFAADKPLADPPGTQFMYSTGTSMILSRIIADQVGYGTAGTDWADSVLFGPLGITSVEHDLDDVGAMSGGAHINMTAQDFARIGLLYLRGGEWDGQQIVPEAWVDYARLPLATNPEYGAHWWVNAGPNETPGNYGGQMGFLAQGLDGQIIAVVPSDDLVIVALARTSGPRSFIAAGALAELFSTSS